MGTILSRSTSEDTNLETFSLVWLDAGVDSKAENIRAQGTLKTSFNELKTFDNDKECATYIQSLSANNRIILISSGRFGSEIVPRIHSYRQIFSIYIYCMDKSAHEEWSKKYVKVQGVYTSLTEMIERIRADKKFQYYKVDEQLSISIFNKEDFQNESQTDTNDHFIYSKILIDCLLQMPITTKEKSELNSLCKQEYALNNDELRMITEFGRTYSSREAIRWFTKDSFLYKTLIKALRIQNLDVLFLLRYVIQDIQLQIEANECSSSVKVYRSQLMTNNELQKLKDSLNQFVSINSFLLALPDRQAGVLILNNAFISDEMVRVLFEIHADGDFYGMKSFSNIRSFSSNGQNEILFSIGSIFQLNNISPGEGNIWIVRMTLCMDSDARLVPLFQSMSEQYGDTKHSLSSFGLVLQRMHKFDDADKYYERLIKLPSSNSQFIKECKDTIEKIYIDKENHELSIKAFGESMRNSIHKPKTSKHRSAIDCISNGEEYRKKGNLELALKSFEKALNYFRELSGDNHQQVGRCYKYIGSIHQENENYEKALENYEQAKIILENHLVSDHPDLSTIYCNIGDMHQHLGSYEQALINYRKSLEIAEQTSIKQLSVIISIRNKIAAVYEQNNDFQQALTCYKTIASLIDEEHVDSDKNQQNIDRILSKLS